MDNPWASGWSDEPDKQTRNDPEPTITTPSWSISHAHSSSLSSEEADLSTPSWSTRVGMKWEEPSDTLGSLWSQTTDSGHLNAWESSTYKGISLSPILPSDGASEKSPPISPVQREATPPIPSPVQEISITPPKSSSPSTQSPHLPPSPDAFGSFETVIGSGGVGDPWSSGSTFPPDTEEVDQWGSAWAAPKVEEEEPTQYVLPDEWEIAKQRKENMDRQVPPELLASILQKCEETSRDLWPNPEVAKDLDSEDYMNNRYSGMDVVIGLPSIIARVAPEEMTLPTLIPFSKTFAAKSMAESIRLSRHAPLTRLSPMSQLMASKGSTAWETSIKSRPEVVRDDLPVGWRVVESDKESPAQAADAGKGKKTGGGLLSFWGRKAVANATMETKRERSMSPVHATSASPRSSIDTAKPPSVVVSTSKPDSPTTAAAVTSTPPPIIPLTSTPDATSLVSITSSQTVQPDLFDPVEAQPAPSAVSRFLGRFSRTKSATSNQRHSLALSSDDLEFLSDSVPSASDDHDGDPQLDALSSMIQSSPLPAKLSPPLAPPPKQSHTILGREPKLQSNTPSDLDALFSLSTEPSAAPTASSIFPPLPNSPASSAIPPASMTSTPLTGFTSLSSKSSSADKPLSSFILPPPSSSPSSRSQSPVITPPPSSYRTSFTKATSPPTLRVPSGPARTHTPKASLVTQPTASLLSNSFGDSDDDEEFSDFRSPPSIRPTSQYDSSFSPQSLGQPLFSQPPKSKLVSSSFDDFDDFVSSPMRSPSPPIPPAKPSPRQDVITPPPKVTPTHLRNASGAAHTRASDSFEVNLFGDTSPTKLLQANTGVALSVTSPPWLNLTPQTSLNGANRITPFSPTPATPNAGTSFSQPPMSFSSNPVQSSASSFGTFNATPPSAFTSSKSKSAAVTGGLSAQDLSFFEGL